MNEIEQWTANVLSSAIPTGDGNETQQSNNKIILSLVEAALDRPSKINDNYRMSQYGFCQNDMDVVLYDAFRGTLGNRIIAIHIANLLIDVEATLSMSDSTKQDIRAKVGFNSPETFAPINTINFQVNDEQILTDDLGGAASECLKDTMHGKDIDTEKVYAYCLFAYQKIATFFQKLGGTETKEMQVKPSFRAGICGLMHKVLMSIRSLNNASPAIRDKTIEYFSSARILDIRDIKEKGKFKFSLQDAQDCMSDNHQDSFARAWCFMLEMYGMGNDTFRSALSSEAMGAVKYAGTKEEYKVVPKQVSETVQRFKKSNAKVEAKVEAKAESKAEPSKQVSGRPVNKFSI